MTFRVRHLLVYYLPLVCNIGLAVYLALTADYTHAYRQQQGFETFAVFYAIGGAVVAVSAITAFLQMAAREGVNYRLLVLALVNAIVPTLLIAILLYLN